MSFKKSVLLLLTVVVVACFGFESTDGETVAPDGILLETLPDNAEAAAREFVEANYPTITFGESFEIINPDEETIAYAYLYQENVDKRVSLNDYSLIFSKYGNIMNDTHYFIQEQQEAGIPLNDIYRLDEHISNFEKCKELYSIVNSFNVVTIGRLEGQYSVISKIANPSFLRFRILRRENLPDNAIFHGYGLLKVGGVLCPAVLYKNEIGTIYTPFFDGSIHKYDETVSCNSVNILSVTTETKDDQPNSYVLDNCKEIDQNPGSGDCTFACLAMTLYYLQEGLGFTSNISSGELADDRPTYNAYYMQAIVTYLANDDTWQDDITITWDPVNYLYIVTTFVHNDEVTDFFADFMGPFWFNLQEPSGYSNEYEIKDYTGNIWTWLGNYKEAISESRERVPSLQGIVFELGDSAMHAIFCFGYNLNSFIFYNPHGDDDGQKMEAWDFYWKNAPAQSHLFIPDYLGPDDTGGNYLVAQEKIGDGQALRWMPDHNFDVKGYTVLSRDEAGQITQLSGVIRNDDSGGWQHFETEAEGELGVRYYPVGDGEPVDVFVGEEADFE